MSSNQIVYPNKYNMYNNMIGYGTAEPFQLC